MFTESLTSIMDGNNSFYSPGGQLAQVDRAPASGAGGRRFESCIAHQKISLFFTHLQNNSSKFSNLSVHTSAGQYIKTYLTSRALPFPVYLLHEFSLIIDCLLKAG